jgi:hypothetical protein
MTKQEDTLAINPWLAGLLSWAVPGGGYLYVGRAVRGLLLGGVVCFLFFFGIILGGHLYGLMELGDGFLSRVFGLFDLGTGLFYVVSRVVGFASVERPEVATAEYGNIFIMGAGLLNYLLALDVFDIASGRKS